MELPFDLDAEVVRLITERAVEVPPFPAVAMKLQRVLSKNDFGLAELSALVEADGALVTQVMRQANSAFYRGEPVRTLPAAIGRIGARELSNIAIAGTLGLSAQRDGALASLRRETWRQGIVSALVCQELARFRSVDPGEAFLAGLLHDFGEAIAYACFESVLERWPNTPPATEGDWRWKGQQYHVELGMALAGEWKLPAFVVECVMRHADADVTGCDHPALIHLVSIADRVTLRMLEATSIEAAQLSDLPGLSADELAKLEALVSRVPGWLASFEDVGAAVPKVSSPSLVAPPPPRSEGTPLDFKVVVHRKGGATERWQAVERTEQTLTIVGPSALGQRHLVNLTIDDVLLCTTVLSCTVSDAGCRVEVKPFAMDAKTSRAWAVLGRAKAA